MTRNFYHESREFYLRQFNLFDIIKDLENDFLGEDSFASPGEAWEYYDMVLKNAGDICANFIWPRSEEVDVHGAVLEDGVVSWAPGTVENMKVLGDAGYLGGTLPKKYGGLNLPATVNNVIVEMVSQADASLMNLFGLQDIAVTIYKFGNEEQKDRVLPKFCKGEVSGSMALTEPDAGSDLQAVALKAIEKDGKWYLDGVKRFITNGSGEVSLVLARSEAGSKGGRGLSMFLYERYRDDNMIVRRIEDKHGIHGSPTCELQFNMAECELVGKRKFGLIKYVMSLMNGARLAVSAQALGIAQAAFDEAVKYANEREQFDKTLVQMPAVYQMLKEMQVEIETSRLLLYRTSLAVDYMDMYERKEEKGEDVREELKKAKAMADFLTPLSKFVTTEMANKVTYDAVQIHGGCGYMKDFPVERLSRDARITNIYEGTTQLQVVAAMASIKANVMGEEFTTFKNTALGRFTSEHVEISKWMDEYYELFEFVKDQKNRELFDYVANYITEIVSILYRLMLLAPIADKHEEKAEIFKFYFTKSKSRIAYLHLLTRDIFANYHQSVDELKADFIR
ncbi:MAG: acyl-CoA dehydrogenase family protein [Candidatus Marinimicrobia bacterium]|nr:acyl-CoA dehydrogenase family protein [Candidatus Neomarinimicrobiota bacterium]